MSIAITGAGVVSVFGRDRASFARAIEAGAEGIRGDPPLGRIAVHAEPPPEPAASLALEAAKRAIEDAKLALSDRVALVMGTSAAGLSARARFEADRTQSGLLRASLTEEMLSYVARGLGLFGPAIAVTTACTASANAIAHGALLLSHGLADAVIAGGADAISDPLIAGFTALEAMSEAPCAPFSEPRGMSLGEGACFFVLERASDVAARGGTALAYVLGYGLSSDAHRATAPDPSGDGLARAMQAALTRAGASIEEIEYLNAHGTGTDANDSSEMRAIRRVFGARAEHLPISSTKSMIGHALGAAAALESLALIEGMRGGFLPPTIHFDRPRPDAPRDPIPAARRSAFSLAMKNSAAFGGANAALIFGAAPRSIVCAREPVYVVGAALLGSEDPQSLTPRLDLSALDPPSQRMTAAIALALEDAGIRIKRELADRAGLFAAAAYLPWDATREFFRAWYRRGRAPATAFSRMVMNGPAGAASRMLSLRGPLSVLAGGRGTTLLALLQASLHLSEGEADLIAVASAEVADEDRALLEGRDDPDRSTAVILVREGFLLRSGLRPLARLGAVTLTGAASTPASTDGARTIFVDEDGTDADAALLIEACRSVGSEGSVVIAAAGCLHAVSVLLERCA